MAETFDLTPERFARVVTSYDLKRLSRSRIICVGCGGSAGLLEDLARTGTGQFILIDPDVITEPNLATQQTYVEDIGRPKVEAIADRLLQINQDAIVATYQASLHDLDDVEMGFLVHEPLGNFRHAGSAEEEEESKSLPEVTLLLGMTDDFIAQARVNRLALNLGLGSVCCQLYSFETVGAGEITFMEPGLTPRCHRCLLKSRYQAYLGENYTNTASAAGAPIFATTRMNALCGMLILALLHGTSHPRWGKMLTCIAERQLVQVRLSPDCTLPVFDRVFAGADQERILFDETVWLPQRPDVSCPDCHGDLLQVRGTFADTRVLNSQAEALLSPNRTAGSAAPKVQGGR